MRVHTFTPYDASKYHIIKHMKYKIYDYGDMCIIAFNSKQVECYRFVDRRQEENKYIEVLEKQPIGYIPPVGSAVISVIDIGLTKELNVFVYGNYLLTVSEENKPILVAKPANVFEEMSRSHNPTHTKQFKRKPLEAHSEGRAGFKRVNSNGSATSIPLVMPTTATQSSESTQKKFRPRMPMMSIPLTMSSAAME